MTRRELLAASAALTACAPPLMAARTHIDKSRISGITDEIGLSTLESIAFAHFYGMQNVEIRNPPGKREYFTLPEDEIKADADLFAKEGLKVSFVNTSLLKFTWPGTEPARRRTETPEARDKRLVAEKTRWDLRMEDLRKGIVGLDTTRIANGAHHLVVSVIDAAGNAATVLDRAVTVYNPPPPGAPNGRNASANAHLAIRWKSTARAALTSS